MTPFSKGPTGWLEEVSLRWQVMLGGCCGLAFLLLLPSSVISHLHSPSCAAAGLSDPNRLWVLSQSAWRSGAATQSTLDFQRNEPNQLEIDHFIELHLDGSVIVVLTLNTCHQAAEPKLSLTGQAHCTGTN